MGNRILITAAVLAWICLGATQAVAAKSAAYGKAQEAASHGEWEQVAQLAQQAVTDDPGNEAAWSLLADAQMALGDTVQAVTNYTKALDLNPKYPAAVLALTSYYLKLDSVDAADRIVVAAEEKDKKGKYDEIKVARGQIHAKKGNMAEATKILMSATEKNRKNPLYPQILARIYGDQEVYSLAEKYYAEAWKLAPGDPALAFEYGLVLQHEKKYNEALELFKVVQEKDPSNKSVDYLIGRLYYAARRWAEAATQFEKAVEKRPDHFLSNYLLGKSYYEFSKEEKKNFYPLAEKWLRKAHELRPERKDVAALLAEVLVTEGRLYYQRALADSSPQNVAALCDSSTQLCHQGLATDSAAAGAFSVIARAWSKIGNLDSAVYYQDLQIARSPTDETEFARGVNYRQRKKDQQGLVDMLKPSYERLDWTTPKAADDTMKTAQDVFIEKYGGVYANALVEAGRSSQAREVLKQMLTYRPGWCEGHNLRAYVELRQQNYEAAVPILLAGVHACPKDGDLWLLLGDSQYFSNPKKKDNVKKASDAYQRACQLGNRDGCDKYQQLNP